MTAMKSLKWVVGNRSKGNPLDMFYHIPSKLI